VTSGQLRGQSGKGSGGAPTAGPVLWYFILKSGVDEPEEEDMSVADLDQAWATRRLPKDTVGLVRSA